MRQVLKLHPESQCAAIHIAVEVARPRPGLLALRYLVTGAIGELSLPPPGPPARADDLWRHSCFEAFLRPASGDGYFEFNFAPSNQWAAYEFTGYRSGMRTASGIGPPSLEVNSDEQNYELRASLGGLSAAPWRLGLSAVIEEASGRKSYWALAHPPGKPDFHHFDGFACELPERA